MSFIDYGPAFLLRMVYHSTGTHCAECVYSTLKGTITIKQFKIDKDLIERYYSRLYKYYFNDNQRLLSMTSTSPKQERPTYLLNIKKIVLYILKYHEQLPEWFDNQTHSIIYYRSNDKWITDNQMIVDDVEII